MDVSLFKTGPRTLQTNRWKRQIQFWNVCNAFKWSTGGLAAAMDSITVHKMVDRGPLSMLLADGGPVHLISRFESQFDWNHWICIWKRIWNMTYCMYGQEWVSGLPTPKFVTLAVVVTRCPIIHLNVPLNPSYTMEHQNNTTHWLIAFESISKET
jgi:hypothetical protein